MQKVYILNGTQINNRQFEAGSVRYPANWCESATEEQKSEIGIITLDVMYPSLGDNQEYSGYTDDLLAGTRTINVVDVVLVSMPNNGPIIP